MLVFFHVHFLFRFRSLEVVTDGSSRLGLVPRSQIPCRRLRRFFCKRRKKINAGGDSLDRWLVRLPRLDFGEFFWQEFPSPHTSLLCLIAAHQALFSHRGARFFDRAPAPVLAWNTRADLVWVDSPVFSSTAVPAGLRTLCETYMILDKVKL